MMTTASEKAAGSLRNAQESGRREGSTLHPATGERARLLELIERDDPLTDSETEEFAELAKKSRAGTLTGTPESVRYKRPSIAGEREGDTSRAVEPTASEAAAQAILSKGW